MNPFGAGGLLEDVQLLTLLLLKGQTGRALGPLIFCSLYWWAGREVAYAVGGAGVVGVCGVVFGALKVPPGTEVKRKVKAQPAAASEKAVKS